MKLKKQYFCILRSDHGFSLIEIMVAMAIMGVASLGVMQINDNMNKSTKTFEMKAEKVNFEAEVKRLLSNKDACRNTLTSQIYTVPDGISPTAKMDVLYIASPTTTPDNYRLLFKDTGTDLTGHTLYDPNLPPLDTVGIGAFNFTIDDIYLTNFAVGTTPETAELNFEISKNDAGDENSYGANLYYIKVPLTFMRDPVTKEIVDCNTNTDEFIEAMCTALNGERDIDGGCKNIVIDTRDRNNSNDSSDPSVKGDPGSAYKPVDWDVMYKKFGIVAGEHAAVLGALTIGSNGTVPTSDPPRGIPFDIAPGEGGLGVGAPAPGPGQIWSSGDLTVFSGTATFGDSSAATNKVEIVAGAITTTSDATVGGNASVAGSLTVDGNSTLGASGSATTHTVEGSRLDVTAPNTTISGHTDIGNGLRVNSATAQGGNAGIFGGNLLVEGSAEITSNASIAGTLAVGVDAPEGLNMATIDGPTNINGNVTLGDAAGNLHTVKGALILEDESPIGDEDVKDNYVVNKGWIVKYIAALIEGRLSDAEQKRIIDAIITQVSSLELRDFGNLLGGELGNNADNVTNLSQGICKLLGGTYSSATKSCQSINVPGNSYFEHAQAYRFSGTVMDITHADATNVNATTVNSTNVYANNAIRATTIHATTGVFSGTVTAAAVRADNVLHDCRTTVRTHTISGVYDHFTVPGNDCNSGTRKIVSGGCFSSGGNEGVIHRGFPESSSRWVCSIQNPGGGEQVIVYSLCCQGTSSTYSW